MRSGFIELVVKKALAGSQSSTQSMEKSKSIRYKPIDSFKKYLLSTLPNIEERVEI